MWKTFYVDNPKGHVWRIDWETREVDNFAYSNGYHNGPECILCNLVFCEHCNNEVPRDCTAKREVFETGSGNILHGVLLNTDDVSGEQVWWVDELQGVITGTELQITLDEDLG